MNRILALTLVALALWPVESYARTARSLQERIQVDGYTVHGGGPTDSSEWRPDESVFGSNPVTGDPEESIFDSKWGADNDIQQLRVTWDKDSLYLGVDAVTWGNNLIVWMDVIPGTGILSMTNVNSWRRAFTFSSDFSPDVFIATWDGNRNPQAWSGSGSTVVQLNAQHGAATFSGNLRGRGMEFAFPWTTLMPGSRVYLQSVNDTVTFIPVGSTLKIAAAITSGTDGNGGPDVAPDALGCLTSDASQTVNIDNYAFIPLDRNDDTGLGLGGPDGVADWDVSPKARLRFAFQPPIRCKPLEKSALDVDRPAIAPTRGERVRFRYFFDLKLDAGDHADSLRTVKVAATVYDLRGNYVRTLYSGDRRPAEDQADPCQRYSSYPCLDEWDGRDDKGRIVPPGVYVLRVVLLEPSNTRLTRPIVVAQ